MIIKDTMCYSMLLWLMHDADFTSACSKISFTKPAFEYEGIAGYIETHVEFVVTDFSKLAKALDLYWTLSSEERNTLMQIAMKGNKGQC